MGWQTTIATVFQAGNTIINRIGAFVYEGKPGNGNLIASITNVSGEATPPYTNDILAGITSYGTNNTSFFAVSLQGSTLIFYSGPSEAGPWNEQASLSLETIDGPLTLIIPASGLQIIGGPVALEDTAEPTSQSGFATYYADSAGNLDFVSGGDGNQYSTGRLTEFVTSTQLINSTTATTILTQNVQAGVPYRFHFVGVFLAQQSAGTPTFELSGTATLSEVVAKAQFQSAAQGTIVDSQVMNGSFLNITGPTMVANGTYACECEGFVEFSTAGTFTWRAFTSAAADTFEIARGSYFEIMPVSS